MKIRRKGESATTSPAHPKCRENQSARERPQKGDGPELKVNENNGGSNGRVWRELKVGKEEKR
jgi:hypothetical protein